MEEGGGLALCKAKGGGPQNNSWILGVLGPAQSHREVAELPSALGAAARGRQRVWPPLGRAGR